MKSWLGIVLAVALTLGLAAPAAFAAANEDAVIALHLTPTVSKNACADAVAMLPASCNEYNTGTDSLGAYSAAVVIMDYNDSLGVAGVQFGVQFVDSPGFGVDVDSWISCSDLEFPSSGWPARAPSGNTNTWESTQNCQMGGGPIVVGVFSLYAYDADLFRVVPRPVDGKVKVADCSGAEDDITGLSPSRLGFISFQTGDGYNPCATIVPVEETTWGGIKTLFQN